MTVNSPTDVGPEVMAWFHESEEICDHDERPWFCEAMADHFLRAFTVEPRVTERRGEWGFEGKHFHRLALATSLIDPLLDRFEGSVLDAEPPCRCGTDAARAEGQMAFVRLDLICPKHDR